jgi:hypothetical protein
MSTKWESDLEALVPPRANQGYLVYPQPNQYVMFRGNLLHGVINGNVHTDVRNSRNRNAEPEWRVTLLVNFWKRHKPLAPACIEPKVSSIYAAGELLHSGMQWLQSAFQGNDSIPSKL